MPEPDPSAAAPRLWRWYAVLLCVPVLVLWRQDNPLFTGPGFIDPWLYYGYFRNLVEFKGTLYFGTYYGSRLSWLLPGWAAHALLPPMAASVVLHLAVHSAAVLALFTALRLTVGLRAGFLTAFFFSIHSWLWRTTGWDCIDGSGIAYTLLALVCLLYALDRPHRAWLLAGAGASLAAAVYTNLFLVATGPLTVLCYGALLLARGKPSVRRVCEAALWIGAGAVAVTVLLGAVNYALDGHFWFYAPSVLAAMRLLSEPNPWFTAVWGDRGLVPYLWFAFFTGAAALTVLPEVRRGLSVRVIFALQLLGAIGFHTWMQMRGTPSLGLPHYACYLLPFTFLALGAIFFHHADVLCPRGFQALCAAAALATAVIWSDYGARFTPLWPHGAGLVALIAAVFLAAALLLRRRALGIVLATAAWLLLTSQVRNDVFPDPHTNRSAYQRLIFARDRIETERRGQPPRIWYSESDPAAAEHRNLASTYLGTLSSLGTDFPNNKCDDTVEPGNLIAVLSSARGAGETARAKLTACWSPLGMILQPVSADRIQRPGGAYDLILFRLDAPAAARRDFVLPPLDRWQAANGATFDGRRLRTPAAGTEIALLSPTLTAPAAGHYRFAIRYRPATGHLAFGAVPSTGAAWLRRDVDERRLGQQEEFSFWLRCADGESFRLAIANHHWASHPSEAIVESVQAHYVPE